MQFTSMIIKASISIDYSQNIFRRFPSCFSEVNNTYPTALACAIIIANAILCPSTGTVRSTSTGHLELLFFFYIGRETVYVSQMRKGNKRENRDDGKTDLKPRLGSVCWLLCLNRDYDGSWDLVIFYKQHQVGI